jgi:N utilization substance protein A
VRLANRLVDWNIDVKTESQFQEMDIFETKKAVSNLFGESEEQEEITKLSELPDIPERIVTLLADNGIVDIETFISMSESKLLEIPGFTKDDFELVKSIIEENVEITDEDIEPLEDEEGEAAEEPEEEKEYYECPECGALVTEDMDHCPNCHVELSFEEEDEDTAEEEGEEETDDSEEEDK